MTRIGVRRSPAIVVTVALLLAAACARRIVTASGGSIERPVPGGSRNASDRTLRVGLVTSGTPTLKAGGDWELYAADAERLVARVPAGETWRIERNGSRLRGIGPDGIASAWQGGSLVARARGSALIAVNGKHYRGELLFVQGDNGISVVNRVRMDDYLRGVVPLEIGTSDDRDIEAVKAQAVTARSYAYVHVGNRTARPYDVSASVNDQLYGGADAETAVANAAVNATRGVVLQYEGRVVNAPYHSACGGSTAAAEEIWRTNSEPYLQRVSDQIPGTDRFYCDIAPRFRWTRTLDGETLRAALVRYLATYTATPGGYPGTPRDVQVDTRTPSGRVGTLKIATDRGNYVLRGNDIRYVLRAPGGEILNSTSFNVEATTGRDGAITRLVLRGTGYGHGVGMCQWGAIGRARAGQDFHTILRTYYPGTTVGAIE
ncbi:MAG TPA: SpoIID/LytB domain-containing protein [Gemmatimonadaceae bacterium]|nr:SpoIID/LytB domain-containing protein [Gemmatimonadaceae bacterium]